MATAQAAAAWLNYLVPTTAPLRTYAFDPPDGGPRFNGELHACRVQIQDGRRCPQSPMLGSHGFQIFQAPVAVDDFWDEAAVRDQYYPACERLLRELTGARQAIVFDHTMRQRAAHRPELDGMGGSFSAIRQPVGRVHVDFTSASGPARIRQVLAQAGQEGVAASECAIFGLWRSLNREPLGDAPLALAAADSVAAADLVVNQIIYPQRVGETYVATYSATHQWFYFSAQTRTEVIVFRHFDGAAAVGSGGASSNRSVPHTAIEDPRAPANPAPRESIELRALAIF